MEENKCCENKLTYTRLKKREEKKAKEIYVVKQFAYVHRQRQRKFHYNIRRLQKQHTNILTSLKHQIYTWLSLTKNKEHPIVFAKSILWLLLSLNVN